MADQLHGLITNQMIANVQIKNDISFLTMIGDGHKIISKLPYLFFTFYQSRSGFQSGKTFYSIDNFHLIFLTASVFR